MNSPYFVNAFTALALAFLPTIAGAGDVHWQDASTLEIEGKGWPDTAGAYDRLPDSAKPNVTTDVWNLSKDSAGLAIRFLTDAPTVHVRWSLTSDSLAMPHMPATGVSGIDLYARINNTWRFIGNTAPAQQSGNTHTFNFPGGAKPGRECLLYLPLYNGTKSLEIGVPEGSSLRKPDPRPENLRRPIVVYGTSIAQGGCASRPGMAWPTILGRMLDRPVINLGFSGSGRMEPPVSEVLAQLDPAAYIIDCIWNIGDEEGAYAERVPALVKTIRAAHPETPILFVGQSHIRPDAHPTSATRAQEAAVKTLQDAGVPALFTVPGTPLIGDDSEATVDGVHMTDLGMLRQAQALDPILKEILASAPNTQASTDPKTISDGPEAYTYQAFPDACRLKNGDILAVFYAGYGHVSLPAEDFPRGGRICTVRSSDEGRTWSAPTLLFDDEADNRDPHIAQLDDGTLICTFFSLAPNDGKPLNSFKDATLTGDQWKGAGTHMVTSRDNGRIWDATARSVFPTWYSSAPVRQLPDGTCILGLYGTDDKTGLSIAATARSTDRGATWEPPVVIKAPEGVSLDAETDIIRLTDGRLYAAMRSNTNDMYEATSDDQAQSWTEAKKAGFPAHCPHFTRLSDGRILLAHRLPNTSIHVSTDDTKSWQGPFEIDSCIGAYPSTVELPDHSILIIYYTEGAGSAIRARRFTLTPGGIEFLPL